MGLGRIHELGHAKCRLIIDAGLSWAEDLIANGNSLAASSLVMAMSAGSRRLGWGHPQLQAAVEKVADVPMLAAPHPTLIHMCFES